MRGADRLIAALEREGTDCVFGLPGGASLPIHDALHDSAIRHVLVRHEAGAGHAAEGYAKASGRVGVALVTSGPGATNLATPIADAHMDSVPSVFLCAQVRSDLRGTNAFQETDVLGMTMPICKHSIGAERPDDVTDAIHEAFHVARTGRCGPVVVDIPSDIARAPARAGSGAPSLPGYRTRVVPNGRQLRTAAQAIAAARRPVLYAGGGVVHAEAAVELAALARLADLPVTTTLMALGAFPASDHRWLGMLGMHGTRTANWAMDEADLVIAVGARFDDRVTGDLASFAQRARVVHIDVDAAEIGKNVAAHVPVVGDAKNILARLVTEYRGLRPDPARLAEWWERIEKWRAQYPLRYDDSEDTEIKPQYLVQALYEATNNGDCILATDIGQHQMWAAQYFHFNKPRRWINSGGLGTMGFGLPAAIGAAVANPEVPSVLLTGDGSFQMNSQELATCRSHDIPVKVVIMNNGYLGMVRQWQELFWDRRYSNVDMGTFPDWVKLAEAYGATGVRLTDKTTLVADLGSALATPGPVVVDVKVTREANVYPMIAPGAAAREMVG